MPGLVRYGHQHGLKMGWYFNGCGCWDRVEPEGGWEIGYEGGIRRMHEYGFDGVKFDGCGSLCNMTLYAELMNNTGKAFEIESTTSGIEPETLTLFPYAPSSEFTGAIPDDRLPLGRMHCRRCELVPNHRLVPIQLVSYFGRQQQRSRNLVRKSADDVALSVVERTHFTPRMLGVS